MSSMVNYTLFVEVSWLSAISLVEKLRLWNASTIISLSIGKWTVPFPIITVEPVADVTI